MKFLYASRIRTYPVLFSLLLAVPLMLSCETTTESDTYEQKINVVSTTNIIHDIVENLAGELVKSTALMGPGIDPHLYKASAGDVDTLSNADIIFYNGLFLEGKLVDIFSNMNKRGIRTVAVAESIDESKLLSPEEFEGNFDPHVWFDVQLWQNAVIAVRNTLMDHDRNNSETYKKNAERYLNELDGLHNYVKEKAAELPEDRKILITAHDAFNYFGRAYGFEVIGLQGISTDVEASTSDIRRITSIIVEREIPAIFVETSVSTRYIEAVKAAVQARGFNVILGGTLFSDALGDPGTREGTYVGMIKYNVDTIVNALRGDE